MAQGVPSTQQILNVSAEALQWKSKQGLAGLLPGQFFQQYTATTALASSVVETNLITVANGRGTTSIPAGALAWANTYDPTGMLLATPGAGCKLMVRAVGTIANTGTPTFRMRLGLTNAAGTTTYVADTTALTTATITGTSRFVAEFEVLVTAYSSTAGALLGGGFYEYYPTTTTNNRFYAPQLATSSFDTTAFYTVGLFATWGTSSSSNTITIQDVSLSMLN